MTGYVYILKCADGSYYTGSTRNLEQRLWQHQNGQGANHTRKHLPVTLVFAEQFERIDEAYAREKQIQGWSRKKKEALINADFNQLHELAKCRNESRSGEGGSGFDTGFDTGFDYAQPTQPTQLMQPTQAAQLTQNFPSEVDSKAGSLSEVEGANKGAAN